MIQSRKSGSNINDDGKALIRKVQRFAADAFRPSVGFPTVAAA